MRVNETFISLQGEGFFTGTPAFFLRFSGCNLQCPFCDTQHQSFTEMTEEEIVREACRHKPRHIVITGGEPALQLTQSLVDKLHEAGFFIQVETNGTLSLPEGIDWVTVSPKKASPVPSQGGVNAPSLLERVGVRPHELKILYMGKDTDPDTILKSLPLGGEGGGARLYLQPLDTGNTERNRIVLREAIDYVMQHPKWSLSLQTHKLLGIK